MAASVLMIDGLMTTEVPAGVQSDSVSCLGARKKGTSRWAMESMDDARGATLFGWLHGHNADIVHPMLCMRGWRMPSSA